MITFLENKKFRAPSLKIKTFTVISCSCFLIDMKFISKYVCCLLMDNVAFPNPHLRDFFKIYIQKITRTSDENIEKQSTKQIENSGT